MQALSQLLKHPAAAYKRLHRFAYWALIDKLWPCIPVKQIGYKKNKIFSIGIVTYINRYEKIFKPFMKSIYKLFPDTEIVIAINGHYDQEKQKLYLADIGEFLARFPNVKRIEYQTGQSLSKLWNQLVINSTADKTFIFNDDIKIAPGFRNNLESSIVLTRDVALLNGSWSHFLISKHVIRKVGWFDERFPGVGNEDEDYETRLVLNDIHVESFKVAGLKNIVFSTKDFSYGENTKTINVKYVRENKVFFDKKWDTSNDKEEGYVFVRILGKYLKLNSGMETPNFYRHWS